ncbi:HlyD family efflux transporter periplasmic adaptor subunit [Devosia algicola]|uniref:HlyD family efflux transporter periplasmic adaptor subunit n=1 Tax=Devosia algicola TaxID=3026418 RepID=A0ABY7YJJ1_9HYPH|nr:HlyD family efflux transporter periplasmic adaptor subunit [Devosia algicola]WDR01431.1 HlyD family efflux transporter periplasmic adaptor subunit [Devosia algicola]
MKKRTVVIALVAVAVVGAALLASLLLDQGVAVTTATLTRQPMQETVAEEGQTRARNAYVISAPVAGQLQPITVREGDAVSAGMIVARLMPPPDTPRAVQIAQAQIAAAQARRDQAAAEVQKAEAQAKQAEREADRSQSLGDRNVVSPETIEQDKLALAAAEQQVHVAEATLEAADADLRGARANLGNEQSGNGKDEVVPIRATAIGTVLEVLEKDERVVAAGAPLLRMGDTGNLEVVIAVLSEDAVKVRVGNKLLVSEWGGGGTLLGQVTRIEQTAFTETSTLGVQEQRVNVIGTLIDPPGEPGRRLSCRGTDRDLGRSRRSDNSHKRPFPAGWGLALFCSGGWQGTIEHSGNRP